jgi:hypothetical protein
MDVNRDHVYCQVNFSVCQEERSIILHFKRKIQTNHATSGTQVMIELSTIEIIYTPEARYAGIYQYSLSH